MAVAWYRNVVNTPLDGVDAPADAPFMVPPVEERIVNAPVDAVLPPTGVSSMAPPVMVTLGEIMSAIVATFEKVTAAVAVSAAAVVLVVAVTVVNAPLDGVVAPTVVVSMPPPVMVTLGEIRSAIVDVDERVTVPVMVTSLNVFKLMHWTTASAATTAVKSARHVITIYFSHKLSFTQKFGKRHV